MERSLHNEVSAAEFRRIIQVNPYRILMALFFYTQKLVITKFILGYQ